MAVSYQTRLYLRGAFGAAINGLANSMVVGLADPQTFNIYDGWRKLLVVTIISAVVGFFLYIKEHPLPDPYKDANYPQVVREQMIKLSGTGDGVDPARFNGDT